MKKKELKAIIKRQSKELAKRDEKIAELGLTIALSIDIIEKILINDEMLKGK